MCRTGDELVGNGSRDPAIASMGLDRPRREEGAERRLHLVPLTGERSRHANATSANEFQRGLNRVCCALRCHSRHDL